MAAPCFIYIEFSEKRMKGASDEDKLVCIDLPQLQQSDGFTMLCVGEQVHRLDEGCFPAAGSQVFQIPALRFRVAGDVHHPIGGQLTDRLQKLQGTACTGRVKNDHIHLLALLGHALDGAGGVCAEEAGVGNAVGPGVLNGTVHCAAVQLHAQHRLCLTSAGMLFS